MRPVIPLVTLTLILDALNANVQLPEPHNRDTSFAASACDTAVTYDRVLLKRVTLFSKYIFTGKVFGVNTGVNGTRVYKVNIRRVLKGDLNEVGVVVKFGTAESLRFSDATVFVKSFGSLCRPLRVRTYGIFLTERQVGGSPLLTLVVDPVLLTLKSIEIIEAAVKDSSTTSTMRENQALPNPETVAERRTSLKCYVAAMQMLIILILLLYTVPR